MRVRYTAAHVCFESLPEIVGSRIARGMAVCEIGGGANPLLPRAERERLGLTYTVVDIDPLELAKASPDVVKVQLDITSAPLAASFDVVISKQLAEHVRDPLAMHRNVWAMLRPGGRAIHFFPTLYAAPFVVNRLVPERMASTLLIALQPHRVSSGSHGKFPAHYRWCRGPTGRQLRRLRSTGFEVEDYIAGFGHGYYARAPLLQRIENAKARMLVRRPLAQLTSYAIVVLRRPPGEPDAARRCS